MGIVNEFCFYRNRLGQNELLTTVVYLLRILFVTGDISCEGYCLTVMCNVNAMLEIG